MRAEPQVARLMLRRLVGPLTMWDAKDTEDVEWEAGATAGLLDGLAPIHVVASPTGFGAAGNVQRTSPPTGRSLADEHDRAKRGSGSSPTGFEPVFWP